MRGRICPSAFLSILILLLSFVVAVDARSAGGQIITANIPAPSLRGNLLGDTIPDPPSVYLPPSYTGSARRYPVLYFLTGFGDTPRDYLEGGYQGFKLKDAMDSLIAAHIIEEMIVVVVSGFNSFGGSFFVNSPVTGNWEDYVQKDLLTYIDSHYRTLATANSRGISGHSMGGFASLLYAMRRPDLFGAVYALSPGLFEESFERHGNVLSDRPAVLRYLAYDSVIAASPRSRMKHVLDSLIGNAARAGDFALMFTYAYGAAFAPDAKGRVPWIRFPYHYSDTALIVDSAALASWQDGFGNLPLKVAKYGPNLRKLKGVRFEVGNRDEYEWIIKGCVNLDQLLTNAKIPHEFGPFEGTHQDHLRQRIEEQLLPYFSTKLAFSPAGK